MSAKRPRYNRRKRRQWRAVIKWGIGAKPRHCLIAGRTGQVHFKRLQTRRAV